jgi:hypothetical protein
MEKLRCCHCGKFMKWENGGVGRSTSAVKIGFKEIYSMWELDETLYFHLECDKKVKEYKQLITILEHGKERIKKV